MKNAIRLLSLLLLCSSVMWAQSVTTAAINGVVTDQDGNTLPGANVMAVHQPTGTKYGVTTREDGQYNLSYMKAGGPYTITVSMLGHAKQERSGIYLQLSQTLKQDFRLAPEDVQMQAVEVTAQRSNVLNAGRTGAATNIDKNTFSILPTISGKFQDFIRLTPESRGNTGYGGNSYVGQDSRYNNTTIDGAYFNNSFGLMGQVGERTGVAPISLDAIEQLQVNIAPYDVRQGNFVGGAMNTVTKSGANNFFGTLAYATRNQGYVGKDAGDNKFDPGTFKYNKFTFSLGGPIMKDKLFFFVNYEGDKTTQPGTYYTANPGGATVGGNMTRVLASDLDQLASFLKSKFNYDPGTYQGYNFETPGKRYLAKLDYNYDEQNKISIRYNRLDSQTPVLESNSSSLGAGNRRSSTFGLNFTGSNYTILENDYSYVGEWNSIIGNNMSNNMILGYSFSDESRGQLANLFPLVDILSSSTVYTSFGSEPFTPDNKLEYSSYQFQDNFTIDYGPHVLTFGLAFEKYHSKNVFFPGSQSVYEYATLADFYADANAYLNGTTSTAKPILFQVRYNNIPGQTEPIQPLDVYYYSLYGQDQYQVSDKLVVTGGLRLDLPSFGNTGFDNANADQLTFMDGSGKSVKYNSAKLPDASILFSPRLGFNYDISGDRTTQLRGGTGIFTGKPAYVWISNQIGNTGVLTGFLSVNDTSALKNYHFNPNPNAYKPTAVTGAPASTYELALTDPNFKFPQQWRTNIAVDQKLPFDIVATIEGIYGKEINGMAYINANLTNPNGAFAGPDNRPRWVVATGSSVNATTRINGNVQDAAVITNESKGYNYSISVSLERALIDGFYGKIAYNYGIAKNTVDPGSIAYGSWSGNAISGNPNSPSIGYSPTSPGNRFFASLSYRLEYLEMGATTFSLFWDNYTYGNGSYTYNGDMNGDGVSNNDLIYIPKNQSEMNFVPETVGGVMFTAADQAAAWDAYIKQDDYLNAHRGEYAERGGAFLPMVSRADLSIVQSVFFDALETKQNFDIRLDILNVGNLIDKNWGQAQHFVSTQPLIVPSTAQGGIVNTTTGQPQFVMRVINGKLMDHSLDKNVTLSDVYSFQLGLKYYF